MNEVEAAGNTPLHNAAYEGWLEGVDLLLSLGAKINASNNAGDRPWHWADNMGHDDVKALLSQARPRALPQAAHALPNPCLHSSPEHMPQSETAYSACRRAQSWSLDRCWCRTMCRRSRYEGSAIALHANDGRPCAMHSGCML